MISRNPPCYPQIEPTSCQAVNFWQFCLQRSPDRQPRQVNRTTSRERSFNLSKYQYLLVLLVSTLSFQWAKRNACNRQTTVCRRSTPQHNNPGKLSHKSLFHKWEGFDIMTIHIGGILNGNKSMISKSLGVYKESVKKNWFLGRAREA